MNRKQIIIFVIMLLLGLGVLFMGITGFTPPAAVRIIQGIVLIVLAFLPFFDKKGNS